jgi:beta-1,4-mannosyl-glycoprotein beta-1,4-N-acetylglucosaminyltransferase
VPSLYYKESHRRLQEHYRANIDANIGSQGLLSKRSLQVGLPGLVGTAHPANPGVVLVVSDIDEVLRLGAMPILRHCLVPSRMTLRTQFYYYSFQWLYRGL